MKTQRARLQSENHSKTAVLVGSSNVGRLHALKGKVVLAPQGLYPVVFSHHESEKVTTATIKLFGK
jgi:hypothetical protein